MRDVARAIPQIVSAIVAIAVIKRENAVADAARRRAREEAEQRRREAERRAAIEKKREEGLTALLDVQGRLAELKGLLVDLDSWIGTAPVPPRLSRLRHWLQRRHEALIAATTSDAIEEWLIRCQLFAEEDD